MKNGNEKFSSKIQEKKNAKRIRKEIKQDFNSQSNKIVEETYYQDDFKFKLQRYQKVKRMKWWNYLTSFASLGLLLLISLLLYFFVSPNVSNYFNYSILIILVVSLLIINFIKGRDSINYYGDKRRRFQRTLTDKEAILILIFKTIFLILFFFLPNLVTLSSI